MRYLTLGAGAVLAALAISACDNAVESRAADTGSKPAGPNFTIGPTATVQVICPKVQVSGSGQCAAFALDSLGFFVSSSVSSWTSSDINKAVITSTGSVLPVAVGSVTITATIGGVSGTATLLVRSSSDVSVSIDGSPVIKPNTACAYTATASGGAGPYTYSWSIASGSATGSASGDTWTGQSSATGTSFVLRVVATDADGRNAAMTKSVFVHSMGDC